MTKQLILPIIPRENTTPKPLEDLLSAIIGLLRAYGYSDQHTVEVNGGWHLVSELPPEDGEYLVVFDGRYRINGYTDDFGWRYGYIPTHWQPLPEPPETKEDNDNV